MTLVTTLASTAVEHKTWWNPYMKGALIAALAIILFVGAAYLLLYTNVGSRLGFLLTVSAATGFMMLLSLSWISSQFPQGPLGEQPGWDIVEIVDDLNDSRYEEIRDIEGDENEASGEAAGQIKADLDAELTEQGGEFQLFTDPADYLALRTFTEGGGRKWPMWWSENRTFGVVEICEAVAPEVPFGEAPAQPECTGEPRWVVTVKNLGALRQPAFMIFGGSALLFGLTLLALRRYERDEMAAAGAGVPSTNGSGDKAGEPAETTTTSA